MRFDDFIKYKLELNTIVDKYKRGQRAAEILQHENLSLNLDIGTILLAYINGTSKETWQYYYLFNTAIPYLKDKLEPVWFKRFIYWPATMIMEQYLDHKAIMYKDKSYILRFTRDSGSHAVLTAAPGKSVPDFYIWDTVENKAIMIEYKFASYKKYTCSQDVLNYYKDGKNLHKAKLLLTFLEAEQKFYLIDLNTNMIYLQELTAPKYYITTDYIDALVDPLA